MKKQIKKNIKRHIYISPLVLFALFTIIMILFINVFTSNVSSMEENMESIESNYVYVRDGDTLWGLCRKYYPDKNIRKKIHEIKVFNDIESDNLIEGQILIFPTN